MAVDLPDFKPFQPPTAAPANAPQDAPKKPDDNTAAKQAPKETAAAVASAFGNLPAGGNNNPPAENGFPPADPKTGAGGQGKPVKTPDGYDVALDKHKNLVAVRPDGKAVANPAGHPYAVAEDGKYKTAVDGKDIVYDPRGNPVAADAAGKFVTDKSGNALALDKQGNYLPGAVYDKNTGLKVTVDVNGKVSYQDGRPIAVGEDGKAIAGESGNYAVYNSKGQVVSPAGKNADGLEIFKNMTTGGLETSKPGGPVFKIDPTSNDIARDAYGNPLAIDDNGGFIKTPDGKYAVYDSLGHLGFVKPSTGKLAMDGSGNPYALTPDGRYARTADGHYAVWDKANGNNMIAVDYNSGKAIADGKGNPLALDVNGNYLKTPDGNAVVYGKINGKSLPVATDESGAVLVIGGKPAAVGKDGDYLKTPDGSNVVYDVRGNSIAVGLDGKVVTDKFGNPLAVTKDGNYVPGAVYGKSSGIKGIPDEKGKIPLNADGMPVAVDDYGQPIRSDKNLPAYLDPTGKPVFQAGTGMNGMPVYKDAQTGQFETITKNGAVYKFNPNTNDYARDDNGNILPSVYDPVNDDPARPSVKPNQDLENTLKNLPQGTSFGTPMWFKDQMFDANGTLDVDKLVKLAGIYDPRVVYDALINSSKDGGWDNLYANGKAGDGIIHPNEAQARQAIAAIIAWQNANGKYNPIKLGNVPPVLFYKGGADYPGYNQRDAIYISADYQGAPLANVIFHELNHSGASSEFKNTYPYSPSHKHAEVIAEFLATDWTGDKDDSPLETKDAPGGFQKLEDAVMEMGNGDRNKGMDVLKRAVFAGDPAALETLKKYFPPDQALD